MKELRLLLLCVALYCPLWGGMVASAAMHTTTLQQLGYPSGLHFDDTSLPGERTLLFHLPRGVRLDGASLRVIYHGSERLARNATLSIAINDLPPQTTPLMQDSLSREWLVPVAPTELAEGQLKVAVRGNIPAAGDGRADHDMESGTLHVSAESSLSFRFDGVPITLRDAWLTLPDEVVVTIPDGPLDVSTFRAVLDWLTLLLRKHHTVRITTLPELGNLVIAPREEIQRAMVYGGGRPAQNSLWDKPGRNIGLVNFRGNTFIAAISPFADVQRFSERWQMLSDQAFVEVRKSGVLKAVPGKVNLDELGMATETAIFDKKLQWTATITPWNLPPGTRPQSAEIELMIPRSEQLKELRVFIYVNDLMVASNKLTGDGIKQKLSVSFDRVLRSDSYKLRMVVLDGGKMENRTRQFPVRVMPNSHIALQPDFRPPSGLAYVPAALGQGFDLFIPEDYLVNAEEYLPVLARLMSGFVVSGSEYSLIVLRPDQVPVLRRNFVMTGDAARRVTPLPVRFDEGKVQLIDYRGEMLLDERRLRMGNVIQLVRHGELAGLWIRPGMQGGMRAIDAAMLGRDDVAIYESDGLILSIDSRQKDLVYPQYPESLLWFEWLYKQRLAGLLLSWVLLSIVMTYIATRAKRQRNH